MRNIVKKALIILAVVGITLFAILGSALSVCAIGFVCEWLWSTFVVWFYTGLNGIYFVMAAFVVEIPTSLAPPLVLKPTVEQIKAIKPPRKNKSPRS